MDFGVVVTVAIWVPLAVLRQCRPTTVHSHREGWEHWSSTTSSPPNALDSCRNPDYPGIHQEPYTI